jgi:DNA-binding transcriptional LysR family regulator
LLTRSSCKITLTDAGRSYVAAYKRILDDVVEAERIAIGEYTVPKGELSITAPIVLGRLYLVPVLSDFLQAYPDIDARLTLADQLVNLTEEGVDTALRVGDLPDSALVATRIGTIQCVFAASPGYLTSRGRLRARPISLSMTVSACKVLQGPVSGALPVTPRCQRAIALIVNSTDAACEAAKAGLGIVSVFSHHVVSSFQDGTLIPVLSDFKRPTLPLSLVRASGGYLPIKLQAFLDSVTPGLKMRLSAARKDY